MMRRQAPNASDSGLAQPIGRADGHATAGAVRYEAEDERLQHRIPDENARMRLLAEEEQEREMMWAELRPPHDHYRHPIETAEGNNRPAYHDAPTDAGLIGRLPHPF